MHSAEHLGSGIQGVSVVSPGSHRASIVVGVVFGICLAIVLIRSLFEAVFSYDNYVATGIIHKFPSLHSTSHDLYIPFGIAHAAWAFFIFTIQPIYIRMKKWLMIAVLSVFGVLSSYGRPGSQLPGCSLLQSSGLRSVETFMWFAIERKLAKEARRRLRGFGWNVISVATLSLLVGIGYWLLSAQQYDRVAVTLISWLLALFWSSCAYAAFLRHGSDEAISRWLGILDKRV